MFDMIGYPRWIEDPAKLEEYYENVRVAHLVEQSGRSAHVLGVLSFLF